jgi:hypothetical protein
MYVKWKFVSVCLEKVLVLAQDWCTVCAKRTIGLEITLMHSIVLQCDVGQVEARFGPFRDSVHLGARYAPGLRRIYHGHGNHFGHT